MVAVRAGTGAVTAASPGTISTFRRARRRAFHLAVRGLVGVVRGLPRPAALGALTALARTARRFDVGSRSVAREQVARAFPDLGHEEQLRLADASWEAMASNLCDMVRADTAVRVAPEADARIQAARRKGPVLVLMGHLGAWELIGPVLAERMHPFGALTANPHNARVDAWLRAERCRRGIEAFDRERDLGRALRWLRRGGTLAVLADHRPRGTWVDAPWFDRRVPTTTGPGRLARAAGATILPVGIVREDDGHRLLVLEPFAPSGDALDDASRCNAALERLIRQSPEEWTWIHARAAS